MMLPSETGQTSTDPVPTRFFENEAAFIAKAKRETGLPASEIIRRSVRLMARQHEVYRTFNFMIELTP